jgi:hypothetical protein
VSERRGRVAFPILGRQFEADEVGERLAAWLVHHWRREHPEAPFSRDRIHLRCPDGPDVPADLRSRLPATHHPATDAATPVHVAVDGERAEVLLGSLAGGAYLELEPEEARVRAWGVAGPGDPGRGPLLVALHEAVRASGLLPLHCAAAVRPADPGATAFVGPSGVGKSTTLLTLVQAGWAPVCEDFAWLDPGSLWMFAWDHDVRLLPDALERMGRLPTRPAAAVGDPKRVVGFADLTAHFGVQRRRAAPLVRLIRLERGTGRTRWGPLPRREAVPPLWEAIGLPLTGRSRQQVATQIGALVDDVGRGSLRIGETPVPLQDLM